MSPQQPSSSAQMAPLSWLLSCFTPQSSASQKLHTLESPQHAPPSTSDASKVDRIPSADCHINIETAEAAHVNDAFLKVEALVQKFGEMRSDGAMLRTLRQAIVMVTEEWQGSFARVHVVSRDSALLLAAAPKASSSPRAPGAPPAWPSGALPSDAGLPDVSWDALLVDMRRRGLAMATALESPTGFYSWVQGEEGDEGGDKLPPPPDYQPYVAAGAQAIFSMVMKLPARNSAVMTIGFSRNAGNSHLFLHKLWPTFLRVIASGMALILGTAAPRYLDLALELREAPDMSSAMSCVVRRLRELSGQAGNASSMWFRVALKPPHVTGSAVLFDVPSEIMPSLRSRRLSSTSSSSQVAMSRNSRLGPMARDSAGAVSRGSQSNKRIVRTSSTPFETSAVHVEASDELRTVVGLEHTLLRAAMEGCNQVAVPDVQKLLNHGGLVAADIFSVHEIRPPASVLLLPLVEPNTGTDAEKCFGAVYCMSSVLTDFADVKQQLLEAVVDVLSPHLFAALSKEPLASQYSDCQLLSAGSVFAPNDFRTSSLQRRRVSKLQMARGPGSIAPDNTPSSTPEDGPMIGGGNALTGRPNSGDVEGSLLSHRTSNSSFSGSPSSYTKALVTGLTDKINTHRMIQSMDEDQTNNLGDLQLLTLLGAGGYGYVFQGRWRGILVAIKLIKPTKSEEDASRAALKHAHEIAILSSVSHPNVLQAYTFMTDVSVSDVVSLCLHHVSATQREEPAFKELMGMEADLCHIDVLELCDQGSLMDALKRNRFLDDIAARKRSLLSSLSGGSGAGATAAAVAAATAASHADAVVSGALPGKLFPDLATLLLSLVELASALAHLHSLGIVHCDIKPDNVLLKSSTNDSRGFTVKLADFGLSRVQDNGCVAFPCNSCGTLAYVAPEALSNKKVDQSIDVYSFGVLMYELYVCKRPYADIKREHLIHGVNFLSMRPMFPAGSHMEYVELARACWAHSPSKRPSFENIVSTLNDMLTMASSLALKAKPLS